MKIAGIVRQSLVDYPGKIAAAVFTQGCNMNCVFCHNRCLVRQRGKDPYQEEEALFDFLRRRKRFLDGVVISGGEPTLQPDLESFTEKVKDMGFLVKLDTNGTHPEVIRKLFDKNLVDYVAMDVKAPMRKYSEICQAEVDEQALLESMASIRESGVDYEFRTTFCPQLNDSDIREIGELIAGAKKYVLQQYRETDAVSGGYTGKAAVQFHDEPNRQIRNYATVFQVRGEIEINRIPL